MYLCHGYVCYYFNVIKTRLKREKIKATDSWWMRIYLKFLFLFLFLLILSPYFLRATETLFSKSVELE